MRRLFKRMLVGLLLIGCPLTSAFPSFPYEEITIEEFMRPEGSSQVGFVRVSSQEELGQCIQDIKENGGDYVDFLLQVAPAYHGVSISDVEDFYYTCADRRYSHFSELADAQILDPVEATKNYKKAIESILYYKSNTFDFQSNRRNSIVRFTQHRCLLMGCLKKTCESILALNKFDPDEILLQNTAHLLIMASDNALYYKEELVGLGIDGLDAQMLNSSIPFLKLSMFKGYVALAYLDDDYMKFANILKREIRGLGSQEVIDMSNKILELFRQEEEIIRRKGRLNTGEFSKRRRNLQEENLIELIEKRNQNFEETNQGNLYDFFDSIKIQFHNLEGRINTDNPDWNVSFINSLQEIEDGILNLDGFENSSLNIYQSIYAQLDKTLKGNYIFESFPMYVMSSFATVGQVQGALERIEAIKDLYSDKHGHISAELRCFSAIIKNLNGDHSEWLEIEDEAEAIREKQRENKRRRRQRKRQNRVDAMKEDISEKKEAVEKQEEQRRKLEEEQAKIANNKEKVVEIVSNTFDNPIITPAEREQAKEERLQRHLDAEERRRLEKDNNNNLSTAPEIPPSFIVEYIPTLEDRLEEVNASSDIPLRELYGLTSAPLEVDDEIEEDTWAFTRDQLKAYLEAMGCTYTHGKSGHKKLKIPSSTHFYQGDQLITIMSEFGAGAVILPEWDKNYVPRYLRSQILVARDKLRALQILSLEAQTD